jgi:uncharacterized tellurite resistance protein B-like protein
MFGRWLRATAPDPVPQEAAALLSVVRAHLPDADDSTARVVSAMAGLIGTVAYADRDYTDQEERQLRSQLERIHGMTPAGVDAICGVLKRHIVEVATVQPPRYARDLLELADRELRLEILEVLVDVAASDGEISHVETNVLRQVTTSLGLEQRDYNSAQVRHRDKLASLKPK